MVLKSFNTTYGRIAFPYPLNPRKKKSFFFTDISPKNWFSTGIEKKKQRKNRSKEKSGKNRKIPIFPLKNRDCGARALVLEFLKISVKYR